MRGKFTVNSFLIAIALAVLGSTLYHIFQKNIPPAANPALVLAVTYTVAFTGSLLLFAIFPMKSSLQSEVGHLNAAVLLPGMAILAIEAGFLLAYRSGWNINIASLTVNLVVALLLIPVGLVLYKETLSTLKIAGIVVCVIGLVLINWK
jgi:drug/metabolite transporter (DMT)-like permease